MQSQYFMSMSKNTLRIVPSDDVQKLIKKGRCERETAYRDIAHQIAMALYGKTYGTSIYGALGKAQNIHKRGLKDKIIIIVLTGLDELPESLLGGSGKTSGKCISGSRDESRIFKDIQSMIQHARSQDITVKTVS